MQLLHASPLAQAEFASLSLVLKPEASSSSSAFSCGAMGEALILPAPLATVSYNAANDVIRELHGHLGNVLQAVTTSSKKGKAVGNELARQDAALLDQLQIFRPGAAAGLACHYRLIQGENKLKQLSAVIMAANKSAANVGELANPQSILGVLVCVGFSGLPAAYCSSPLQYSLRQRISDGVSLLTRISGTDPASARAVMATFLLTEDDARTTNDMVEASDLTPIIDIADAEKEKSAMLSPIERIATIGTSITTVASSSKAVKRASMNGTAAANNIDGGDVPVETTAPLMLHESTSDIVRQMADRLNVLSIAEAGTALRKYEVSGKERKANLDLTGGGKSKFRRRKGDNVKDPDFDNFDYKGPKKDATVKKVVDALSSTAVPASTPSASVTPSMPIKQAPRTEGVPPRQRRASAVALSAPKHDVSTSGRRMSATNISSHKSMVEDVSSSAHSNKTNGFDPFAQSNSSSRRANARRHQFADEEATVTSYQNSVDSQVRVQVNIALNEDLTCSYKQSQLSTCTVEGVMQVQVKSNSKSSVPFFVLLRDPAKQLESIQENKKFADDVSDALIAGQDDADRKFTISVPAMADNYFPVLRYKCVPELRPVPIRVQTRVKLDRSTCRVALQISSNPNNDATLTDLTIIMGVPTEIRGETLVTQPAGGVWNESKRSVIWCVSELGEGEKFQLQARFEAEDSVDPDADVKPKFPVLVRCQCLFSQLSEIEVEVRDVPDVFPADVAMKLARRFRLSHRERS